MTIDSIEPTINKGKHYRIDFVPLSKDPLISFEA